MTRASRVGRLVSVGSALLVLVAAFAPPHVVACTCVPFDSLREWVEGAPDGAMVVGHIVRDRQDGSYDLAVTRWYGGTDRRPLVVVRTQPAPVDGVIPSTGCGGGGRPTQRLLFYGWLADDGIYHIGNCMLTEDPASERGQALERHAVQLIGPAEEPDGGPAAMAPPAAPEQPSMDGALVFSMVAISVVALFGVVVIVGIRRRGDRT